MSALGFIIGTILVGTAIGVLAIEAGGWLPYLSRSIVRTAARRLPQTDRERWLREWLADLDVYKDRPLTRLVLAVRIYADARPLSQELRAVPSPALGLFARVAKRAWDFLIIVPVVVPLVLLALLVRLDSPGPVFYRCRRVGFGGETFEMLKFRKMHHRAEGAHLTAHTDDRFTRAGKWLARLKVDELPQLWNVVRGEMSLVGPRPESPVFADRYRQDFNQITRVRPGIVGLSQLAFAEESRILDPNDPTSHYLGRILPQKIALDRFYVEHWSLWFDIRIILWTLAAVVLRRPVAVDRQSGRMRFRRR